MASDAKVTIYRLDPTVDGESRYETYLVPPEGWEKLTVLDTLRYICEHLDPELSFRESCRIKAICNICMVRLNKKTVLACDTQSQAEMLIEPLSNHPVLKDLVVRFPDSPVAGEDQGHFEQEG